ncbi:hypothetical protein IP510_09120 [Psychrobacter sp. NG254]|nr:hypothetical protein [Psychrobacter sp. NG254]
MTAKKNIGTKTAKLWIFGTKTRLFSLWFQHKKPLLAQSWKVIQLGTRDKFGTKKKLEKWNHFGTIIARGRFLKLI